jgi:hypothetical protein
LSHSGSREDRPPWWFLPPAGCGGRCI